MRRSMWPWSLGFFADEGLDIELTNGGGADKVMTAVVSGGADIGLAGPESCIYVHGQGKDDLPVIFAQLTKRDGSFLVGRTDDDFTWDDLRGKTILGGRKGGVPEMTLEYVMKQNGVVPQVDAVVDTSVQFAMMAGAFTGGQGDYVTLFEPTATEVEKAGHGYILCSIGEQSGEIPYTAYFASQSYMASHPEVHSGLRQRHRPGAIVDQCAHRPGGGGGHGRPVPGHVSGHAGAPSWPATVRSTPGTARR